MQRCSDICINATAGNMQFPFLENGCADWEINIILPSKADASFISVITSMVFKNQCWKHVPVWWIYHLPTSCPLAGMSDMFISDLFLVLGWRDSNSKSFFKETLVSPDKYRMSPWTKSTISDRENHGHLLPKHFSNYSLWKAFYIISPTCHCL